MNHSKMTEETKIRIHRPRIKYLESLAKYARDCYTILRALASFYDKQQYNTERTKK